MFKLCQKTVCPASKRIFILKGRFPDDGPTSSSGFDLPGA